jgi:hypothetical protein
MLRLPSSKPLEKGSETTKKRTIASMATAFGGAAILCLTAAMPAQAATQPVNLVTAGETQTVTDPSGLTTTIELGTPAAVTTAQIKADPGLTATQKNEILSTNAVAATKSNHWSQFTTGGSYTQTQNGTFYYNGSRVWVTQTYAGTSGSHACFTNYVVSPWAISNIAKSDSGSTTSRTLTCGWDVRQWTTFTSHAQMTATISKTGGISGFGATVG